MHSTSDIANDIITRHSKYLNERNLNQVKNAIGCLLNSFPKKIQRLINPVKSQNLEKTSTSTDIPGDKDLNKLK